MLIIIIILYQAVKALVLVGVTSALIGAALTLIFMAFFAYTLAAGILYIIVAALCTVVAGIIIHFVVES